MSRRLYVPEEGTQTFLVWNQTQFATRWPSYLLIFKAEDRPIVLFSEISKVVWASKTELEVYFRDDMLAIWAPPVVLDEFCAEILSRRRDMLIDSEYQNQDITRDQKEFLQAFPKAFAVTTLAVAVLAAFFILLYKWTV
jgi:hypothetical protein